MPPRHPCHMHLLPAVCSLHPPPVAWARLITGHRFLPASKGGIYVAAVNPLPYAGQYCTACPVRGVSAEWSRDVAPVFLPQVNINGPAYMFSKERRSAFRRSCKLGQGMLRGYSSQLF